jgi:beta-lactamase superfamily II metal-dependent hydrolase
MNRGGFSWRRLTGVSAAKSRLSKKIGVPLTRSGRQRKFGAAVGCSVCIAVIITLVLFLAWGIAIAHGESLMTVSAINVGQGDSIFVQFPNGQDMLVDAGDPSHGKSVVDYLHSRSVSDIDILVPAP